MIKLQPPYPLSLVALFETADHHLAAQAVIKGAVPGSVLVDDRSRSSAVMVRANYRFHLFGSPDLHGFNQSLRQWFDQEIFPEAQGEGFSLYFSPGWEAAVENEIMAGRFPLRQKREYYEIKLPGEGSPIAAPDGFDLLEVDRALLSREDLDNLDDLQEEMQSERESVEAFLANSFGVAIRNQRLLVAWCLSEYNWDGRCEVGIATHRSYRRRGLATLAGRAFLSQAASHRIGRVGWHCSADNQPSGATAGKIGFQKLADYEGFIILYHLPAQLALHGSSLLDQGQYLEALEWFEKAFALEDPPGWAFFEAGRAHAMLHEPQAAFNRLHQAADRGFQDRTIYEKVHSLDELRGSPEWIVLMKKLA